MQHARQQANANVIRDNPTEFGPLTIKANGSHRLPLGRYREADPTPQFNVHYEPAIPRIVTHEIIKLPVDDGRDYVLFGQFQSFYDQDVRVRVKRQIS